MQNIKMYVNADSALGEITDEFGQRYSFPSAASTSIVRGQTATYRLRLTKQDQPYPFDSLSEIASWQCILASDWQSTTPPEIVADNDAIAVDSAADHTDIIIPFSATNTVELVSLIDGKESITLNLELIGFLAGETSPAFVLQIKGITILNRIAGTDTPPTPVEELYLTPAQISALIAAHANDTDIHITNTERAAWNAKPDSTALTAHTENTSNPHGVTKAQLGLDNVNNTSDADKPISTATQTALNTKANATDIPSDLSELTDTTGLLSSGSSSGGADWFMSWSAANFPQDWNEATWTNVGSNRPAIDYDSFKFPVWAVDYAVAEGLGLFMIDEIPTGATNLVVNIPAAPSDGAATGDNMGWKMDIAVNEGAISTVTLGSTALSGTTDVFVTGSYTVALSGISAAAGDMITCLIYPDTAVTAPKQCDWQVKAVRFEVS